MDPTGMGLLPMISERHQGTDLAELVIPDATYQVGAKHKLPVIAQWGYNNGMTKWAKWDANSGNHFTYGSRVRGYALGAHIGRVTNDMAAAPEPRDLGYLFPRQFPVWSTRLYTKDGKLVRTSKMEIDSEGKATSDYRIEVGEWPQTVGVPVRVKPKEGRVTAVAEKLTGWPKLLPEGDVVLVTFGDADAKVSRTTTSPSGTSSVVTVVEEKAKEARVGEAVPLKLEKETEIVITGPEVTLPAEAGGQKVRFTAELTLTPDKPGQVVEITVLRGTVPYEMRFSSPPAAPAGREE